MDGLKINAQKLNTPSLGFHVYIQIDDDKSKHMYKTHIKCVKQFLICEGGVLLYIGTIKIKLATLQILLSIQVVQSSYTTQFVSKNPATLKSNGHNPPSCLNSIQGPKCRGSFCDLASTPKELSESAHIILTKGKKTCQH